MGSGIGFFDPAPIMQKIKDGNAASPAPVQPKQRVPDSQYFKNWENYNKMIAGIKHAAAPIAPRKMEAPKPATKPEVYRSKEEVTKTGLTPAEVQRGRMPGVAPRTQSLLTDD